MSTSSSQGGPSVALCSASVGSLGRSQFRRSEHSEGRCSGLATAVLTGIFVTLSDFNEHAEAEARESGMALIDGRELFRRAEAGQA